MKKIWKWLLFVLVILLAAGCVFLYRYINRIRYNDGYVNGNTAGNLYNEGYFCEKDGIVYFANPADKMCIRDSFYKAHGLPHSHRSLPR